MIILRSLGIFLCLFLICELMCVLIGWILACTKSFHRIGIRWILDTVIGFMIAPYLCRCKCDGSCGNWVCPKFKKTPGKFEVTDK